MHPQRAEHIVVGGGVIGAAIAYEAARRGSIVLCISDRNSDTSSASLASGAMLGAFGEITADKNEHGDWVETEFRIACAKAYEPYIERLEVDSGCTVRRQSGTYIIANAAGKDDLRNINAIREAAERYEEKCEWVEATDVPGYRPHRFLNPYRVLYLPRESSVNSADLVASLRVAATNTGRVIWRDGFVRRILVTSDCVRGVELSDGTILEAESLVLAAGYSSRLLVDALDSEALGLPTIKGGKGASLILKSDVEFPCVIRTPNRDFACGTHVLNRGDGTLYVGATNRISDTPGEQAGVTLGELHVQLHSCLHEINTAFRTDTLLSFRVGTRPLTSDGYPLVGATCLRGLHIATGTYRNGILMAPMIAEIIGAALAEQTPGVSNPFSPEKRHELVSPPRVDNIIRQGVRDLVSFIQEPHGNLPYERSRELERFLENMLVSLILEGNDLQPLIDKAKKEFLCNPQAEGIPALFYNLSAEVAKH